MARRTAGRPYMPGYGIPKERAGMLPWSFAKERLATSHDYWLATVWPDGRPHVMPVWGAWLDDELWFSTDPRRRVRRETSSPIPGASSPPTMLSNQSSSTASLLWSPSGPPSPGSPTSSGGSTRPSGWKTCTPWTSSTRTSAAVGPIEYHPHPYSRSRKASSRPLQPAGRSMTRDMIDRAFHATARLASRARRRASPAPRMFTAALTSAWSV